MGLFNRFFNKNPAVTRFEMVTERGNGYYAWNGKLYHSDIVRACIRPKVRAIGKLVAKHIRNNAQEGFKVNPEPYIRFLLEDPNPYMSGQMLQEKLATQLELNNNAFAYIHRDDNGYPIEIYPIQALNAEAIYDRAGYLYLKFVMQNGKMVTFPYSDIIHLRQDYNSNDIFGESPAAALTPLMEIVNTTDQGIVKAIKNSNVIRWLLKYNQSLRPEDIKKNTEEFVKNYLSTESTTVGAAATDAKAEAIQVEPKDFVPNALQMDKTTQRIYSFFNVNEKIIQSKYTEDEWNAYYESVIEPLAIQMSNEYTRKLFTRRERGFGNKIIFEASSLQYASMSTKLNLLQMVDRGAMTPNEWREVLNLGPIEGGDKPIRRLDTAVVEGGASGAKED
ncbi:phage portal protein [Defluviitalea saccharophila]|uniref:Phage portal protein n=1 Tax=Defluviitalea saccharophila TaxID=879970 RepID=A0ABZ2Y851_9FIRM